MSNTIQDTGKNRYEQVRFARRRVSVPSLPGPQDRAEVVLAAVADCLKARSKRGKTARKRTACSAGVAHGEYACGELLTEQGLTNIRPLIEYQTGAH